MLLVVDIGNTNIVVGCFDGENLLAEIRLKTDLQRTRDEYSSMILSLLRYRTQQEFVCTDAIISSVVPPLTTVIKDLIKIEFDVDPIIVSNKLNIAGINLKIANPASLGADRIADIVAAKLEYGLPTLVIDFGTATTIDYIDGDSNYHGGTISPGLEISLDALVSRTAQLPRIARFFPDKVIANDTITAMQSGTFIGYECLVSGLIDKIELEANEKFEKIITTGGLGKIITDRLNDIAEKQGKTPRIIYDGNLTLKGVFNLWKLNR